MPVQVVFMDEVHAVRSMRYAWAEDGSVLLTLDCQDGATGPAMTFGDLRRELKGLCSWQLSLRVTAGLKHALTEILTIYHAFENALDARHSLMLVSTPPDEYFEGLAAAAAA